MSAGLFNSSLAAFMRAGWPVVEQGRELIWNWHLDAICAHLEAVLLGTVSNLAITVPPGCTKSRTVGCFYPAWAWTIYPHLRFLYVSNAQELASRESMACRRLIESSWYQDTFRPPWKLRDDQNAKHWYENTVGGHRQSIGVSANVTGKKGDQIIADDLDDAQKVQSEAERKSVHDRWDNAIWDRCVDFKTARRVMIGQRTHINDCLGHWIESGEPFELRIPEEFEPSERYVSPIGWTDPRRRPFELLRPDQFGTAEAVSYKRRNKLLFDAKHNQRPRSRDGIHFKAIWLQKRWRFEEGQYVLTDDRGEYRFDADQARWRYGTADGAASVSAAADYTVISSWVVSPRFDLLWVGCRRVKAEIPDQLPILKREYQYHEHQFCGIEAVLGNVALYQHATRSSMVVRKLDPKGRDKLARATPAIILAESGRLWLPGNQEADRVGFDLDAVCDEVTAFSGDEKKDEHNDITDTLAWGVILFNELEEGGAGGSIPSGIDKPAAMAWLPRRPDRPTANSAGLRKV